MTKDDITQAQKDQIKHYEDAHYRQDFTPNPADESLMGHNQIIWLQNECKRLVKERDELKQEAQGKLKNNNPSRDFDYKFFYWGPLLFKTKLKPKDLKECAKLCSKKSSHVNDTLAGVIKQEYYVSTHSFIKILDPYLVPFRHAYHQWYGKTQTKQMELSVGWVNYMKAGEFNPPHMHPGCDFSSVLFVKIPQALKEEHKKFTGVGGGPGAISFTYGEFRPYTLNHMYFFPEEGDFYIFPATLTHFVAPFMSGEERISMSGNFNFK